MKNKSKSAPVVENATANAVRIIQQEREKRAKRAMERVNQVLKEERCTMGVAILIRPGQYPQGDVEIIALE